MVAYKRPEDADSELLRLLLTCVPENEHGNKTITHLAELIPCTKAAIWRWIRSERIHPVRVKRLVEIGRIGEPPDGKGRVSREDFERFVYNR